MRSKTAAFLAFLISSVTASGQSRSLQPGRQLTVADVVKRSSNAVVQIVASDSAGKEISLGSGFIISADGRVVTNFHVIKGAHSAIVKLSNGSSFTVTGVLASDVDRDLAVLKVDGRQLAFLTLVTSDSARVGDHVVAIGSPLGLEGTVSDGIVSALREEDPGKRWIQTTAPVSHGNSGGPLVDMSGNVVGVITMGIDPGVAQNLNFAVPSDSVRSLILAAHEPISFESAEKARPPTKDGSEGNEGSNDREQAASFFKEGSAASEAKQYERAIHLFQESVRLNPDDAYAWHALGLAHFHLDQYEECLSNFLEATKRSPKDAGLWRSLGGAYSILKRYPEALSAYQEAVGLDARDALAWYGLGLTYDDLHDYEQAVRGFKQAAAVDPLYSDAWYKLGAVLNVLDRYDESISALKKAVDINPDYADAWFFLGSTYESMKRYKEAIDAWKKQSSLKPTDGSILGNEGIAYSDLGDFPNAEDALKRAVALIQAGGHMTKSDMLNVCMYWRELASIYDKERRHREADYYRKSADFLTNEAIKFY